MATAGAPAPATGPSEGSIPLNWKAAGSTGPPTSLKRRAQTSWSKWARPSFRSPRQATNHSSLRGSTVMTGILKLTVGLLFGSAAIAAMRVFPGAVLGVMLFFAGIELALPARDQTTRAAIAVTLITAVGIVATNTLAGFLFGALASLILQRKSTITHPPGR
jgi:hypothetical protein